MLLVIVLGHEFAHFAVARLQGIRLKKLYLGIPLEEIIFGRKISTVIFKTNFRGVEYGVSWLLLGGFIDFHDFEGASFRTRVTTYLAGPLYNLVVGLIPMIFFFGFGTSFWILGLTSQATLEALGQLATGAMPLSSLMGPVGAINFLAKISQEYNLGYLLVWVVLNLSIMTYNFIPIPALDGGQILMAVVLKLFGEKARKPVQFLERISFYFILVIILFTMTKDLW